MTNQEFRECISACVACAIACNHCAASCLGESNVEMMARCIQLNLECAAVCRNAVELMSLGSERSEALCRVCGEICEACAQECEIHAVHGMDHCKYCAEACRKCAEECGKMAA